MSPAKKRFIGISLKMYFRPAETLQYLSRLLMEIDQSLPQNITLFIIPDFLSLSTCSEMLYPSLSNPYQLYDHSSTLTSSPSSQEQPKTQVLLGAQNCFYEDSGPFTGEVSPANLRAIHCSIVELGHAERRRLFGETDEMVAKKVAAVLQNGMIPLVCIGETKVGSVAEAIEEMKDQVGSVLDVLGRHRPVDGGENVIIFAYEPVWAIGAAKPAEPGYVVSVTKELRRICEEEGMGEKVSFIYGGSAGRGTFEGVKEGVDGLFLGRFGHDIQAVMDIIDEVAKS